MSGSKQFWQSRQLFEGKKIRTFYFAEQKLWLFSAVDVCNALTDDFNNVNTISMRFLVDGKWENVDVMQKKDILQELTHLQSINSKKFEIWLEEICKSIPEGCYLSKNAREYEFLNLACNRFLDLYNEVNSNSFMEFSSEMRLYKIKDLFSVYSELLLYEPIKEHINLLEKSRPPMESVLSDEFIKFIRNILIHFPFFITWDQIYVTKNLVNWVSVGKTIDKFLIKYTGSNEVQYRFMEAKSGKWRYPTISFPKDYSDEKIYIKDMINEKDGILLCAILMYNVVMSQIIEISESQEKLSQ